jgi:putative oxidoreductase
MAGKLIKRMFLYSAGLTFTNMARLFMRLFTGVMFMQFGIRQISHFSDLAPTFHSVMGLGGETSLLLMILIEIICSTLIILGLFTRFALIPTIISMVIAEFVLIQDLMMQQTVSFYAWQAIFLPIMFLGIFLFMMLAGPGKISLDYIISVHLTSIDEKGEAEAKEFELEES